LEIVEDIVEEKKEEEEEKQGDVMQRIGMKIMGNPFAGRIHSSF
jgi:hypothetical protein